MLFWYFFENNILQTNPHSMLFLNRMTWQWAETLVEIRVTLADIRGTTK